MSIKSDKVYKLMDKYIETMSLCKKQVNVIHLSADQFNTLVAADKLFERNSVYKNIPVKIAKEL